MRSDEMSGARTYRQKIENGRVVARPGVAARKSGSPSIKSGTAARTSQTGQSGWFSRSGGQAVILSLIGFGVVIVLVSITSLRNLREVRELGMEDAFLKARIHRLGNAQQSEMLKQQQALNDVERMALLDPELTAPRERSEVPPLVQTPVGSSNPGALREGKPREGRSKIFRSEERGARLAGRLEEGRRDSQKTGQRGSVKSKSTRKSGNGRAEGMIARTSAVNGATRRVDR
jgi:hypothetical protein